MVSLPWGPRPVAEWYMCRRATSPATGLPYKKQNNIRVFAPIFPNFFESPNEETPHIIDVKIRGTTVILISSINPFPTSLSIPLTNMSSRYEDGGKSFIIAPKITPRKRAKKILLVSFFKKFGINILSKHL